MLLTITTTHRPATDLGHLLFKHPARVQSFPESIGVAHVFYPEATDDRCTAALLLEVDPVGLVRRGQRSAADTSMLGSYVNDRPYAGGSMLALAVKDVFATAMTGRCAARPELAATAIPLTVHLPALRCRGGADLLRRLVEPLGWRVTVAAAALDPTVPSWGDSPYLDVRLTGELRLADALRQLYVLLPVLDDAKHYWVSTDEIDKLIRAGGGWLAGHPERDLITHRYLAHQRWLTRGALARLAEVDQATPADFGETDADADPDPDTGTGTGTGTNGATASTATDPAGTGPAVTGDGDRPGSEPDRPVPLAQRRRGAVLAAIRAAGARTVGDFGCGEGALLRDLVAERSLERIVATDVSVRALQIAADRLHLDRMSERERARLEIVQSSLTYRDDRLAGLDAAVLMEVIEHVDPTRLAALQRCVFGFAAPGTVLVTTPNAEYNVRYPALAAGAYRHRDHRFEWTRAQFRDWAEQVTRAHPYTVRFLPIGPDDPDVGPPTQFALFIRSTP
ncbi:3' terminal RNA ribose 2'-O-methyltransferase Hen1 [Nakamurella sp.]|uniref:3' terminal RNA ribose 2'-O-methyltransferase Hen1 n=1 Tax=Nakamurella sp. TaxID=1869182 RepID=UPI003B3B99C2